MGPIVTKLARVLSLPSSSIGSWNLFSEPVKADVGLANYMSICTTLVPLGLETFFLGLCECTQLGCSRNTPMIAVTDGLAQPWNDSYLLTVLLF